MRLALCFIFFLSGAAALIFETLWFRLAGLQLGVAACFPLTAAGFLTVSATPPPPAATCITAGFADGRLPIASTLTREAGCEASS